MTDMAKKIKKTTAPIDERETFVSIRKTFAETGASVESKLHTLYALQQADTAIEKILQLRGDLPGEVEDLEAEIAGIRHRETEISQYIEGLTQSISDNKQNIIDCDTSISNYRKQIDNVTNSREFDSLNKEIENLEILRTIAEKHINEARAAISEKKAELEEITEAIGIREEDLKEKKVELAGIVETTAEEEKRLRAEREACAAGIDERTMSAYERIRASAKNHLAVVTVYNNDSCGGCFNTIIPQRLIEIASNKKLIICEHCGRIIVNPDFKE